MFEWDPVLESGRKMVGLDPAAGSDEDLFEAATALEELRRSMDATQMQVLAELRHRQACDVEFGLSTGAWLAREAGLPVGACKKRAAVAEKLRRTLTVTAEALLEGRISWDHARVLSDACNPRIVAEFVELQGSLIDLAQGMVFERWRAEVLGIAAQLDQDGGYDPNEDPTNNTLRLSSTLDGLGVLNGTLTAENLVITEQALNAIADELFRQFTRDREVCPEIRVPSRTELMALALVEIIRRAMGIDLASTKAPRPEVNLVTPASDPEHVATGDGVRLADGSVRTLLCAAAWFPLIIDSLGNPLAMGTATRYATAAQRRAIRLRDGGCVFPGCDAPHSWCDAHHVEHHEHGGATEVANLASLCRHHHGITHTTGWAMHTTEDGWFWWQSPSGRTFWSQRDGRQREGPPPDPIDPPPWPPPPPHRKRQRRRRPVRSRD